MHVSRLKTANFKGRDLDIALDPVTVIAGDNFAGKSSVPMALRLGLTGYLPPPIGKLAGSIWTLAGNPDQPGTMEVELTTDTGRKSRLVYSRTAKGKVSCDGGVPMDMALPGLLVEPLTFFAMTAAQRTQAVFEACDPAKIEVIPGDLHFELDAIQASPRKAADEIIANCRRDVTEAFAKLGVQAGLAQLEAQWKDDLKAAKVNYESKRTFLASLSQLSRERPGFDHAKLDVLRAEKDALKRAEPSNAEFVKARNLESAAAAKANAAESALDTAEYALSEFDSLESCPTCGAHEKGWKDAVGATLRDAVKQHRATVAKLADESRVASETVDRISKEYESAHAAWRAKWDANQHDIEMLLAKKGEDEAWQRSIAQRDQVEAQMLSLGAAVEVYKQAVQIAYSTREAAVQKAFGAVLQVARGFTDDLLNSPLEFHDGQLGRRVSKADKEDGNTAAIGSWISHEGFSGTEQLLAYAGFAVALARQAPIRLVIMDELGRLNLTRRVQLLARMRKLVETGVIDQFVGCDVEPLDGTAAKYVVL